MNVQAIIQKAHDAGITIWLENGKLKYQGNRHAVGQIIPALSQHKAEVLKLLTPKRQPTGAEFDELNRIVPIVCQKYDCDPLEIAEALQIALGDVEDALICYRDLLQRMSLV